MANLESPRPNQCARFSSISLFLQHCNQSKGIHSQKKRVVSSTRYNGEIKSSN